MSARRKKKRQKAKNAAGAKSQPVSPQSADRHDDKGSRASGAPRRGIAGWKKAFFALVTVLLFFGIVEGMLAVVGVRPVLYNDDPYVGFSAYIPLFIESPRENGQIYMATAPNKLQWFNYQEFSKEKPAGAYRIFCMGGSTTYGHPYDDKTSFSGWLREFLKAADPSREWEVINCGGVSYASYREARLMEELVHYEPDMFIVLSGHNEFLERRTYASMFSTPAPVRAIGAVLGNTRTYSLVRQLVSPSQQNTSRAIPNASSDALPPEVVPMLDNSFGLDGYSRDDELTNHVLEHYRFNLERMVDIASSVGAGTMFVAPASCLRDCAPFKSEHRAGLTDDQRAQFFELIASAKRDFDAKQFDSALDALNQAAAIDDRYAHLYDLKGRVLDGLGRFAEAKLAYLRAIDEDVCPLRSSTDIVRITEESAAAKGIPYINFVQLLEEPAKEGIPGTDVFLDHVHPTISGNRILALALFDQLRRDGVVHPTAEWGDEKIADVVERVEGRLDKRSHGIALRNLALVLNWAGKGEESGNLALKALELIPTDTDSHLMAGYELARIGRLDEAERHFRSAIDLDPRNARAFNSLGQIYAERGELDKAVEIYSRAVDMQPSYAAAHNNLAAVLIRQQKWDEAALHLAQAVKIIPTFAEAHFQLGRVHLEQNNLADAMAEFERALEIQPDYPEAEAALQRARDLRDGKG